MPADASFFDQFRSQSAYLASALKFGPEAYFFISCAFLIFLRTLMMLLVVPFIGSRSVPGRIKVGTAMVITLFLYPVLRPTFDLAQFPGLGPAFVGLILKEALIGFAVGLLSSLVFYGIQAAGLMVDNQRGVANAQILIPQLGTQSSIFGLFQFQAAIAIFLAIGGHREFLKAYFEGFLEIPILTTPRFEEGLYPFYELFIRLSADVLMLAVRLSAPVMIAIFLADVVLGIANKVAPAMNVFELGFGVKGVIGVVVVFISIVVLYSEFADVTLMMVDNVRELFRFLSH